MKNRGTRSANVPFRQRRLLLFADEKLSISYQRSDYWKLNVVFWYGIEWIFDRLFHTITHSTISILLCNSWSERVRTKTVWYFSYRSTEVIMFLLRMTPTEVEVSICFIRNINKPNLSSFQSHLFKSAHMCENDSNRLWINSRSVWTRL